MSNSFYNSIYFLDTAGTIVTDQSIKVKKIVLVPNASGDSAVLHTWDVSAPYAEGAGTYSSSAIKGTITGGTTLTMASGTLLPSTVRDGDVLKIVSSETGKNSPSTNVVTTAGDDKVVICANAGWTNEATKWYHFTSYPYRPAFELLVPTSDKASVQLDFGDGIWLPNLILETLSPSAKLYIYAL